MQSELKNCKTKKQVRKPKLQRGGSGARASLPAQNSRTNLARMKNNMPSTFRRLQQEVEETQFAAQFPEVPKYIPKFTITVQISDLEDLKKIFTSSPSLDKLISSYKLIHLNLKDLNPKDIKKTLLEANSVLVKMIELLKNKYIYARPGNLEQAMLADKWCDYIQKLIESNKKNIAEINEYLA